MYNDFSYCLVKQWFYVKGHLSTAHSLRVGTSCKVELTSLATNTCARYGHLQSLSDPAWRSRVDRAARAHWLVQTSAREFTHKMFASAALGNHCWVELKRLSGIIRSMVAPEMYTVDTCALFTITIWRQEAVII